MPTKAKHKGPRLGRLRKIAKHILEQPRRMDMGNWYCTGDSAKDEYGSHTPKCGTVGCIAGWAVQLYGDKALLEEAAAPYSEGVNFSDEAQRLLGLTARQAGELFLPGYWPEEFREQLDDYSQGTKRYAKVVADRIEDFAREAKESRKRKRKANERKGTD